MSEDKFILDASEFDKQAWTDLTKNIKWLKGCTYKTEDRPAMMGIFINHAEGWAAATEGHMIAVWMPKDTIYHNGEQVNPITLLPDGLWFIDTVTGKVLMMSRIDGMFPNIKAIMNTKEQGRMWTEGELVMDVYFNPILFASLTQITNDGKVKMTVCERMHFITMNEGQNFGVLMGMAEVDGKSALLRTVNPDVINQFKQEEDKNEHTD